MIATRSTSSEYVMLSKNYSAVKESKSVQESLIAEVYGLFFAADLLLCFSTATWRSSVKWFAILLMRWLQPNRHCSATYHFPDLRLICCVMDSIATHRLYWYFYVRIPSYFCITVVVGKEQHSLMRMLSRYVMRPFCACSLWTHPFSMKKKEHNFNRS